MFGIFCPECGSSSFRIDATHTFNEKTTNETYHQRWYCGCMKCGNCFDVEVTAKPQITEMRYYRY